MLNPCFVNLIGQTDSMSRGLAIAGSGLLIVFAVLILISLFIAALPHLVSKIDHVLPETDHSIAELGSDDHREHQLPDDVVIAAIGFVMHTELTSELTSEIGRTTNSNQAGN